MTSGLTLVIIRAQLNVEQLPPQLIMMILFCIGIILAMLTFLLSGTEANHRNEEECNRFYLNELIRMLRACTLSCIIRFFTHQ